MKKILLISTTLLFIATSGTFAQTDKQNYVEVSTRAEKQITPDEIYLTITLEEQTSKGKISIEKQEQDMVKALKSLDINVDKNLTVQDMNSNLQQYLFRKDAILATKSFTLKVSTAQKMGQVFDALKKVNISNVDISRTAVSPALEKSTKDELLVEAAKKAQENATILVTAVGSKAGKVIYMQNYYSFAQPFDTFSTKSVRLMSTVGSETNSYDNSSIEMAKTTVSINVLCRFAIEN